MALSDMREFESGQCQVIPSEDTKSQCSKTSEEQLPENSAVIRVRSMTLELVQDIIRPKKNSVVMTPYGNGVVLNRGKNGFKIRLAFGGILYAPITDTIHRILTPEEYQQAMDHLEQIRRLQLTMQCVKWNIPVHDDTCVACLFSKREVRPRPKRATWYGKMSAQRANGRKVDETCDVCGNPVCPYHKTLSGQEHFTMCVDCSCDLNQVEHQLNAHHPDVIDSLDRLLCYYTRMTVNLAYFVPYVNAIVRHLTAKQRMNSQISLGTSGLGFVGAALGVAGAASMLTPAGPAVLIAACVTSATSGTLQLTHSGYNTFLSSKQANQLADRIVGWHGLCLGILGHLEQLRQDLLAEQTILFNQRSRLGYRKLNNNVTSDVWNTLAVGGFLTSRHAMTGVGVTSQLGASYSQVVTTGLQGVPIVGAAFAVGCMAMDAHSITAAFKSLTSPSDKEIALKQVEQSFPIQIPSWIEEDVSILIAAIRDLRERQEEQRRQQEAGEDN